MLKRIDHLGIAVQSLTAVKNKLKAVFDLEPEFEGTVEEQRVNVAGFKIGDSHLEYLEPTSKSSPIAKFLEKRGEGLHHFCVEVENLEGTLIRLRREGVRLIDETPRPGADGKLIAFIHPSSMNGVLIELSQTTK